MNYHKPLLAAAVLVLLAACSRVNADNYAKVTSGMTRDEVHKILGAPDSASGGGIGNLTMTTETWKSAKQTISITFTGDKVALKSLSGNEPAEK